MRSFFIILLSVAFVSCASTTKSESVGQYFDSSAITGKVKTALAKEKDIESLDINVDTYKNIVQLSGFVDNRKQKTKAEELSMKVEGVQKVINSIEVKNEL